MASTIHDVARLAGVSAGTVSRVLNDSPRVDPHTRARVLQVIEDLDFRPSPLARRLSTGKTRTVAVVSPYFTRPSVVERLRGIAAILSAIDYELLVFNVETAQQRDDALDLLSRGGHIDGLLLVGLDPSDAEVARIERAGLACVLIDASHPRLAAIVGDDVRGGKLAVRHLHELGHRRIALVAEMPREAFSRPASSLRLRGARLELRASRVAQPAEYLAVGEQGRGRAREMVSALMALPVTPTGIICTSDMQAMGALEAARDAGRAVPGELSIVGYDDLDIATYLGLTTIRQPLFESGMQGARILVSQLNGAPRLARRRRLKIELVRRTSTGPGPTGGGQDPAKAP